MENILLENVMNESILYFSPPFREMMIKLSKSNDIASDILKEEGVDIKPDITFIDIDKEDGYLSFNTMRNGKKFIMDVYPGVDNIDTKTSIVINDSIYKVDQQMDTESTGTYTKSRSQVKLGKFVNKLFPGKYSDKEVEEFVNLFKARIENSAEKFEIVEGDDIAFWYNSKNYKEVSGTLGNSCMSTKNDTMFKFYTLNPEVCRLLILKEDDKILGRALIWKLDSISESGERIEGVEFFMDRQYTIKDSDVDKFRNYAKEKGWAYKTSNNHHSMSSITYLDEMIHSNMVVQLKPYEKDNYDYDRYPYLDTFRRYDPKIGQLFNDDDNEGNEGQYILDSVSGGHGTIEGGHYSEWHDRNIPEGHAVWSDYLGDWLDVDTSTEVTIGSPEYRGWYPDSHDRLVYDEYLDKHLNKSDSVYSDIYDGYLYKNNASRVICDLESDGSIDEDNINWMSNNDDDRFLINKDEIWYKKIKEKHPNDWGDFDYINRSLLLYDDDNIWIPKLFKLTKYRVIGVSDNVDNPVDITGISYLSKVDSNILGYDVDMDDKYITDVFKYHDDISNLIGVLEERLAKKIDDINELVIKNKFKSDAHLRNELSILTRRLEELEEEMWF